MRTTLRAALSVLMLLGFYVFAFAIVAVLGYVTYLFFEHGGGSGAGKFAYLTIVVAAGIVVALVRVLTAKPRPEPGLPLRPDQTPELWHLVNQLAAVAGTRPPDEILLVPDVNAAVSEDARLLGLLGGKRRLYLGVPLLQGFTVAQLRSVLAHELGHYSRNHTRLGEIAYRGRLAIGATVGQLSGKVSGWLLRQYGRLYLLVEAAVSRRQELEADQLSVRVAGRATAQATLRELPVLNAAWGFYSRSYLQPGWEAGYAPLSADFFGGFQRLLVARANELAELRTEAAPEEQSRWDSHPSVAVRVAAMDAMPDQPVPVDARPATELVPRFDRAAEVLFEGVAAVEGRRQVGWDEFTTAGLLAEEQRQADVVYRAAARLLPGREPGLPTVLTVVETGRLPELAAEFFPNDPPAAAAEKFAGVVELLLRVAAVRVGIGRWQHSWAGPARLVGRDGALLELTAVARLVTNPATLDQGRALLAGLGLDVHAAVAVDKVATAHGSDIVGGIANMKVNEVAHDVVILDNGLILKQCPKSTDGGKKRLVEVINSAPVVELAGANMFIAYEEIGTVTIGRRIPVKASLTMRDGRTISLAERWGSETLTKDSQEALLAALAPFVTEPAAT